MADQPEKGGGLFDRRTMTAILATLLIVQVWMWFTRKPEPPVDPAVPVVAITAAPVAPVTVAPVITAPARDVPFNWCDTRAQISTDGAGIHDVMLTPWRVDYRVTPIWSWAFGRLTGSTSGPWVPYNLDGGPAVVLTNRSRMLAAGSGATGGPMPRYEVVEAAERKVVLRGVTAESLQIDRVFSVRSDCSLDVITTYTNVGPSTYVGKVWIDAHDHLAEGGGWQYTNVYRPIGMAAGSVTWITVLPTETEHVEGPVQWFGLADNYFGAYVVGGVPNDSLDFDLVPTALGTLYGEHWTAPAALAPGASTVVTQILYVGPKETAKLAAISPDLSEAIYQQWFGFFVAPLLWLLRKIHEFIPNWGLSIIALTVLLKTLLFPLTHIAFKSSQAMQELQPQMAALKEKYADNPEEMNRQTMALFKDNGVNPVGGCLPTLVQIPIWISLYSMLQSCVEIYQTEFLYLKDLSSPDPYAVLPALTVVMMFLQQRMMPMGNMDPAQQRVMQIMPLIFGLFFFTVPSGLVVYIFVNMVLTMLQQWWIKRSFARAKALRATA